MDSVQPILLRTDKDTVPLFVGSGRRVLNPLFDKASRLRPPASDVGVEIGQAMVSKVNQKHPELASKLKLEIVAVPVHYKSGMHGVTKNHQRLS